ncbi:cytochrome P450 6k1-like [Leptopilina heterotoma]|uniref:cytochrome P450 6k1-like n=1 Tax=Leptopilina heterotoma TaxID=63436 RepID=UPI001CA98C82|nr:cytochrome P450 6k1-like [Leptopilina heterotoma]
MTIIITTLLLVCAIVLLFRFYAKYKLNYWKRRGVESLPTDSIFGNFKDAVLFRTAPGWHLGILHKAAATNLRLLGFYIFHKPCILIKDPKLIRQIMVADFENFSDRHFGGSKQTDSIGMVNLFGLKNPAWKYVRTKITPTLTKGKLKLMLPLMKEVGENMVDYIDSETADVKGIKKIDAQELNYKYTTDLISIIGLGTKLDSFKNPNNDLTKVVHQFFHSLKRMIALVTVFFMPELIELFGSIMLFDSSFIKKVFFKALQDREKSGIEKGDFLDSLIKLKNEPQNPDYKFEGNNLFYQSGTFFSGFESSSTATSFTIMELAKHSEFQQKAREDVNAAIEKHGLTYEAFNDMKYLEQCIAEGIRLHPPVATIDRYTRQDYQIPGTDVVLEKGTAVYISLYGLHQDPQYFKDPSAYNPERYNEGVNISEAYIPFGVGPRMCVGMKIGQLHAKVVIAMILRKYEMGQLPIDKISLDNRSTFTAAANGINLQFKEVQSYISA